LQTLLPKLKALGAKVHTVALSPRADHELMQTLSNETGGWYEQVENAGQLQKVFLRIFEKVGNPDTVPLKDNQFKVDESIREVTLIVFRAPGAAATQVSMPDGQSFDQSNAPGNVVWHQDEGYDLLTIREPQAGDWRIRAQLDPDNRVMILTDLKMLSSELSNRIIVGQRLPMDISFFEKGELITRREFVDMVQLSAEQIGPHGFESEPRPLRDDGQGDDPLAYDGKFEFRFAPDGDLGRGELLLSAEGATFQREKRMIFELLMPAIARLSPSADEQKVAISVVPVAEVIDPLSMEANADVAAADGSHVSLPLTRQADHSFLGELNLANVAGAGEIQVRVRAQSLDGSLVGAELPILAVQGTATPSATAIEPVAPSAPEAASTPQQPDQEGADTATLLIWFGAANASLIVLGGLGFWLWRRRSRKDPFQLLDDEDAGATAIVAEDAQAAAQSANKEAA
jgi:uncharacterized protein (TIGR03503 family)